MKIVLVDLVAVDELADPSRVAPVDAAGVAVNV